MAVLGKTWGQVRYAIFNYELDCYIICGEFRITVQALKDYIDGVQDRYERPYHDAMLQRELSGIHALAFEGRITEAYGSLLSHGYPVSAMDDLMQKTRQSCYNDMPAGETEAEDFYDIPSLPIPDKAYLYELADMFQVSSRALCYEMGISDYTAQVDWPTIYDYLVVEQFLNRNIPMDSLCCSRRHGFASLNRGLQTRKLSNYLEKIVKSPDFIVNSGGLYKEL